MICALLSRDLFIVFLLIWRQASLKSTTFQGSRSIGGNCWNG